MPKHGPDRTVTDDRLLLEFVLQPHPAFFASDFEDSIRISRQQISKRLSQLEEEGYVVSRKAAGRRMWWITEKGRTRVAGLAREKFDDV